MKALKLLVVLLLAIGSFSAANAQIHHRVVYHRRHHVIVKHRPYHRH